MKCAQPKSLVVILLMLLTTSELSAQASRWILPAGKPIPNELQNSASFVRQISEGFTVIGLDRSDHVEYDQRILVSMGAEPDKMWRSTGMPDDPLIDRQWHISSESFQGRRDVYAPEGWNVRHSAQDIVVGVLDSGMDWQHEDLVDNVWQNLAEDADGDGHVLEWVNGSWVMDPGDLNGIDDDGNGYVDDLIGWDFVNDDNDPFDDHFAGHGTHVSGIIGAVGNNATGVSGIAWDIQLMALKFLDEQGTGYTSDAIEALAYARAMGADVTNNSWGAPIKSQALEVEIQQNTAEGQLFIAAAGNNYGNDNDVVPFFPASYPNPLIVSVTSINPLQEISVFANFGAESVDIAAPGTAIYSTLPGNQYGFFSGTSMAAPIVTGGIALLMQEGNGLLGPTAIVSRLQQAAEPTSDLASKCLSRGKVSLWKLLRRPSQFDLLLSVDGDEAPVIANGQRSTLISAAVGDSLMITQLGFDGQIEWAISSKEYGKPTDIIYLDALDVWAITGLRPDSVPFFMTVSVGGGEVDAYEIGEELATSQPSMTAIGDRIFVAATGADGVVWLSSITPKGVPILHQRLDLRATRVSIVASATTFLLATWQSNGQNNRVDILCLDQLGQILEAEEWLFSGNISQGEVYFVQGETKAPFGFSCLLSTLGEEQVLLYRLEEDLEISSESLLSVGAAIESKSASPMGAEGWWIAIRRASDAWPELIRVHQGTPEYTSYFQSGHTDSLLDFRVLASERGGYLLAGRAISAGGSQWELRKAGPAGQAVCPATVSQDSIGIPPQVVNNDETPAVLPGSVSTTFFSPIFSPITLSESFPCGVVDCQVEAFFALPELPLCEDDTLTIKSEGTQAQKYEWRVDGIFSSSDSVLSLEVDDDDNELYLLVTDGVCSDELVIRFEIEQPQNLLPIDTVRCAPSIVLESQIVGQAYSWTDSLEEELATSSRFRIRQSGEYVLTVTDKCDQEIEQLISVQLTGDCVWPGDVNADGAVDQLDHLLLGLVHGRNGPVRPGATSQFMAQNGPVWADSFPSTHPWAPGVNYQHADCDGNGVINAFVDGAVVTQNRTGPFRPAAQQDQGSLGLTLSILKNQVTIGDTIPFIISLQDSSASPETVYGISLDLQYNLPLQNGLGLSAVPSWLGVPSGDLATFEAEKSGPNRSEISLVRTDLQNRAGSGTLIGGGIVIQIDDIGTYGLIGQQAYFTLDVGRTFVIRANGERVPVNDVRVQGNQTVEIILDSLSVNSIDRHQSQPTTFHIFPNPARRQVTLFVEQEVVSLPIIAQFYSLQGQLILESNMNQPMATIDVGNLAEGMYLVRLSREDGWVMVKRLLVR